MAKWWLTWVELVVRALAAAWAAEHGKQAREPPSTAETVGKTE